VTIATGTVILRPSPRGLKIRQSLPSITYYGGWLVGRRRGSQYLEVPLSATPRPDLIIEGVTEYIEAPPFTASSTTDSGGGAVDPITLQPQNMRVVTAPTGPFDTGTGTHKITPSDLGRSAFVFDNHTLYRDDLNGQLPRGGTIDKVEPFGSSYQVWIVFDNRGDQYSATGVDAPPANVSVRCVMTALPAYTASGGTITVTATGALGTQDGVTLANGDEVWLPEYAGTANSSVNVSAANSGPYEVVNKGGTGVQAVLRRPSWWAHGAPIPNGAEVKVAEGTLFGRSVWDVGAASGTVIGTDDPSAYPREVIQQVTLSSSALAITNVPIRDAAKTVCDGVLITAGGTTTSTVDYRSIAAATPGPIGTATITIDAVASGGGKNGTADTSTINASIRQQ
jgi:hypothetical protein